MDQHHIDPATGDCQLARRGLLKAVAAASVAAGVGGVSGIAEAQAKAVQGKAATCRAYVGTYSPKGKGIYCFDANLSTGRLSPTKLTPNASSPSWIAFAPGNHYLYAVNEVESFNGAATGAVSAYAVDQASGELTMINTVSSGGAAPAHLSVHPSGKFVFVANYVGGNVAVLPVRPDGGLQQASDIQDDAAACGATACEHGPDGAAKAPPGSYAISDHDKAHAHMIQSDPQGRFVVVNDLGLDRIIVWRFDEATGKLSEPRTVNTSAGAGPRHFLFHPNGKWFYSLNEEASTLAFLHYDAEQGALMPVSEVSTLPKGFAGTNFTSEVILAPDGKHLYCLNRLHDTIAVLSIDPASGQPTLIGEEWTRGSYPRHGSVDPSGRFLYVCNQRSDNVALFRILPGGKLKFASETTGVGSPAVIAFLA